MYTQAISQTESSLVETEETQPVASTSSLPAAAAPVQSQPSFESAPPTVAGEVSTIDSRMDDTSLSASTSAVEIETPLVLPEPTDAHLSPFLNAQILAASKPGAAQAQPVPPYVPRVPGPSEPQATGVVKVSAATKVITNAEKEKMKEADVKDLGMVMGVNGKRQDIWLEEDVIQMSVGQLKKHGIGRGMTGQFAFREGEFWLVVVVVFWARVTDL